MKKKLLIVGFILVVALGTGIIPAAGSDGTGHSPKPGKTKEALVVIPNNAGNPGAGATANTSLGATMLAPATGFTDEPYYINYKIRTGDFYAQTQEDGVWQNKCEPVWQFRAQVGASSSAGAWSSWECVSDLSNSTNYESGATYAQPVTERWTGVCLSDADNIYIGMQGWEDEDQNGCTYNSGTDDNYSSSEKSVTNLSGTISRNSWQNFNSGYVDCGSTDKYYKIFTQVWWNYAIPVDPSFTLTDPTGERLYTITLTDNNYRITSWDYQVSDDYEFSNILADVTGITENTADIGELPGEGTYYVRIRGINEAGTGDWTSPGYMSTSMGCETGFCPPSITVHHYAGSVAPVDATITYEVVESNLSGSTQCWITRNLGATSAPTSSTVSTEAQSGWYWQFNRKQGYNHSGALLTPSTTWETSISETSSWSSANDPCALLLGDTWRIPTSTEWNAAITNGSWSSLSDSYSSVLVVHTGQGILEETSGSLSGRGSNGRYWSSTSVNSTQGYYYTPGNGTSAAGSKMGGCSLRCIRSY